MSPDLHTKINHIVQLHGWCPLEKAQFLANLVVDYNVQTVVEVGIFAGRSLIAMAMACQSKGSGVCWGIDPWVSTAAIEGTNDPANDKWWQQCDLEQIYRWFIEAVLRFGLTKECRWFRMRSDEVASLFADGSVDLVHIDGNHSEEMSTKDVELWFPKLKPRSSFVCIDDINWKSNQKAYSMLKERGKLVHETDSWACIQT